MQQCRTSYARYYIHCSRDQQRQLSARAGSDLHEVLLCPRSHINCLDRCSAGIPLPRPWRETVTCSLSQCVFRYGLPALPFQLVGRPPAGGMLCDQERPGSEYKQHNPLYAATTRVFNH